MATLWPSPPPYELNVNGGVGVDEPLIHVRLLPLSCRPITIRFGSSAATEMW